MAYDKTQRDEYDTVNLRMGIKGDNYTLVAYAKNLTDEEYLAEVIQHLSLEDRSHTKVLQEDWC